MGGDKIVPRSPQHKTGEVVVPQGHLWIEGDAPYRRSVDSNMFGPVPEQLVIGKVTHRISNWRLEKLKWWEWKPQNRITYS